MNIRLFICICLLFSITSCANSQDCVEGINKLPMYGGVKKCPGQIEADQIFLAECDKEYKTRKEAAAYLVMRGWQYLYSNKPDTAMMRFNQAYLLDSLNAKIYWGFGNLLGMQKKFQESIPFFKKSLILNPNSAKTLQDMSTSYGNLFVETRNKNYLNASIDALKKAINLDAKNPQLYGQLTAAYCYFMQKDSARKYLKITEQLDPNAVNPEVKKFLSDK